VVISPLFFLRHATPVLPHYQLVALPALALVVGAATLLMPRRGWRIGVLGMTALLAVAWTTQVAGSLDRASAERPPQSALSSILRESQQAAAALHEHSSALFFTHGDDPAIDGEAAVFRVLLWEHPDARVINGQTALILPQMPAALMASLSPFQAWEEWVGAGLVNAVAEYPRRAPAPPFVADAYDGSRLPVGFAPVTAPPLQDGTLLEGWRVRRIGERLRISTLWSIAGQPLEGPLQQFHHLYAADDTGGPPLFVSDVALPARHWREGERVIVIADVLAAPPGRYMLIVGHYTLPDVTRVLTESGDQDHIRVGEFRWE
jgi:hypothetical protein